MLRIIYSFLAAVLIFSMGVAAEAKIVFIDIQKVATSSKAGLAAQAELETKAKKFKEEIEKKQKSGESQAQLQAFAEEKQKELMKARQKIAQDFMKKLQKAIEEYAKQKGYKLILEKNSILYGKPELDKTEEFLKFFNSKYGK